ncbi:DUF91 domain-containing protein [Candidatus Woesearchaeota archaeon]|nr:MAG: DUF91 domain-containing protein [Candidatus Woesearchaeota archaeon]
MELEEAYSLLSDLRKTHKTIIIVADCTVEYKGRAESYLPPGERVILIKRDRTVLVHQDSGSMPVNYMKENSDWRPVLEKDKLELRINNISYKESMLIVMNKVFSVSSFSLSDGQKIQLVGTERDMADMIYANPDIVEKGLRAVATEEQTKYGFVDVLCYDRQNNLVVIECKRYTADLKAVSQLRRYVERIKKSKGIENVRGILCAPKITSNAKEMLFDFGFSFKAVKPPAYMSREEHRQRSLADFEHSKG